MLPIALDAFGGDKGPDIIIEGAREARRRYGVEVILVGDKEQLKHVADFEVVHASEVIGMDEEPGSAVRKKKDSSLVIAAELVRDGKAAAMVSAGNTGATMAAALLRMGRISKVSRPAIATTIPVPGVLGHPPTVLLDSGANAECKPEWLVQFGQMGAVYSRCRFGVEDPTVAVLSIGEEEGKGNSLLKDTTALLKKTENIRFFGNVEGRDFLRPSANVVVTDGFTGNMVLKTLEGGVGFIVEQLKSTMRASVTGRLAGVLMKPKLRALMKQIDPEEYGGAMLLGIDGVCIVSHGSSNERSMAAALGVARDMVEGNVVEQMRAAVAS